MAVVIDDRLAALRSSPQLRASLIRRLGRGRLVAVRGRKTNKDGIVFLLVNLSSRTHGWIQKEALASPTQRGDDVRLLRIINASSSEYEKISLACIFLEYFSRSPLRSQILLIMGDTAEAVAAPLSKSAAKQLGKRFTEASDESVYLNYSGLDRYNRLGVSFFFDSRRRELHYDGWAWREILRSHPKSSAAALARTKLDELVSRFRQ
ncbi:MAG TPA: hypothetical protein VLB68_16980 [Pyrinomonadaceae bacterium]|nr:hypothetical protein [Pyrinomonadaceae bacterium]